MLFNSFEFLIFFPLVTILFFVLPHKWRWFHLLAASCIFYTAFIPAYIFILFFTIVIDYAAGILIENAHGGKRKAFLVLSLLANIGVLALFKYYNFFIGNINALTHTFTVATTLPLLNNTRFTIEDFSDNDHMNFLGAARFSKILNQDLLNH
jgi:alginate O-acetyltransferase complex protein AlgI